MNNEIIIKENDEKISCKMEVEEHPITIFEELINIVKLTNNYFNIYLKQNSLPPPQNQPLKMQSV